MRPGDNESDDRGFCLEQINLSDLGLSLGEPAYPQAIIDAEAALLHMMLKISFQYNPRWGIWKGAPTYADLMLTQDPDGGFGNFLATENNYLFVRNLQRANRVLPLVGDFAGDKALISVGNFLKNMAWRFRPFTFRMLSNFFPLHHSHLLSRTCDRCLSIAVVFSFALFMVTLKIF